MTKKKSTTDTMPPPPASDAVESTPAENHPALVGSIGVRAEPTLVAGTGSPTGTLSVDPMAALRLVLARLNELQHADYDARRHRAMTLIAEARALL